MKFTKIYGLILITMAAMMPIFAGEDHNADKTSCLGAWCIEADSSLEVTFGAHCECENECSFVSIRDNLAPEKSKLIFSDNLSEPSKKLILNYHDEELNAEIKCRDEIKYSKISVSIDQYENLLNPIDDDKELLKLMTAEPGLIWTGSGISVNSGIPTLPEFYNDLGLELVPGTHKVTQISLRKIVDELDSHKQTLFNFLQLLYQPEKRDLKPSPAHENIGNILNILPRAHYITSNLDHLEDKLNYREILEFVPKEPFEKNLYSETLEFIERKTHANSYSSLENEPAPSYQSFTPSWILMVGLRVDDYGIAAWADHRNIPLFFVNPNPPELRNEFKPYNSIAVQWIKADAQEYLPALYQKLGDGFR